VRGCTSYTYFQPCIVFCESKRKEKEKVPGWCAVGRQAVREGRGMRGEKRRDPCENQIQKKEGSKIKLLENCAYLVLSFTLFVCACLCCVVGPKWPGGWKIQTTTT